MILKKVTRETLSDKNDNCADTSKEDPEGLTQVLEQPHHNFHSDSKFPGLIFGHQFHNRSSKNHPLSSTAQ